jgi:hypothetical protein
VIHAILRSNHPTKQHNAAANMQQYAVHACAHNCNSNLAVSPDLCRSFAVLPQLHQMQVLSAHSNPYYLLPLNHTHLQHCSLTIKCSCQAGNCQQSTSQSMYVTGLHSLTPTTTPAHNAECQTNEWCDLHRLMCAMGPGRPVAAANIACTLKMQHSVGMSHFSFATHPSSKTNLSRLPHAPPCTKTGHKNPVAARQANGPSGCQAGHHKCANALYSRSPRNQHTPARSVYKNSMPPHTPSHHLLSRGRHRTAAADREVAASNAQHNQDAAHHIAAQPNRSV